MQKQELINEITKPEYKKICKKILPLYSDDLYQELFLAIADYNEERLKIIHEERKKFFIVGLLCRMAHSKNSPFYSKIRKPLPLTEDINSVQYENEQDVYREHNNLKPLNKKIVDLYHKEGSFRNVEKVTGVNYQLVRQIYKESITTIKAKSMGIKILLVTQHKDNALKFHRQITPHARLIKTHPEIHVTELSGGVADDGRVFDGSLDLISDEKLQEFNIVYFLRHIHMDGTRVQETIDRVNRLGLKSVLDIDDYWNLPHYHPLKQHYKDLNYVNTTENSLRLVDHVITTTSHFADIIKQYNKNITVLPNCISPDDKQFTPRDIPNNRVRFGWIGGVYHSHDINSASASFCKVTKDKEIMDKYQLCLGGYNVNRTQTQVHIPKEYHMIETFMSCNYHFRDYDKDYMDYLQSYTPELEHISYDKDYRRIWARDVFNYGQIYNEIDVAMAPLIDNQFSRCKSELKIVEAGWMGKAIIVSDMSPYSKWIDSKNGIKVKHENNNMGWYLAIKKLTLEPNYRKDLAAGLQETIKTYFDMDKHNQTRAELYYKLME